MGNSHSTPGPRRKGESKHSRSQSTPVKYSRKINNRLSKPKVGGETPNPIPLPRSLSRRNSKASIQQTCLPDPPARLNSIDGGTVPYPAGLSRSGSIDLGRQNSLTGPGWSHHPSARASRETLNGNGSPPTALGSAWLERRRSLIHDAPSSSMSPPLASITPQYARPMTAPAAENYDASPLLEPEDLPPPTASSTASFHSALQSPTRIQLTPSPTKYLPGQNGNVSSAQHSVQHQNMGYTSEPPYQVPVRRRSLLQAAAPGTATRPKVVQEPEYDPDFDMMTRAEDEVLYVPPSRLLALSKDGVRPETPQDQGALGVFRRGSLFVTNGAPSPIPSSPSLRAASGGSQRPRDSSLLSLPPVSPTDAAENTEEPTTATPRTPTKSDHFTIPRKPIASLPSSPQSAKKPVIQIDTVSPISPTARNSLRLVPPSPSDDDIPDFNESTISAHPHEADEVSFDEDPHKRHLFQYSIRNKQFMNGQYQPSPSSDYSEGSSSAGPSKPALGRSPFSYEGSKLQHATDPDATDVEGGDRYSVVVEPTKGFMGLDTPALEEIKPKPLVIRKTSLALPVESDAGPSSQGNTVDSNSAVSSVATEEKPTSSSNGSDMSDQSQAKQSSADSGYSSASSSVLPPPKSWKRALNRLSAPEQLAEAFDDEYPEMRLAKVHTSAGTTTSGPVPAIPYTSTKNGPSPTREPPLSPTPRNTKKEIQRPTTAPAPKTASKDKTDDEAPPKKPKKKRRLSFKRLSFKSEKRPEIPAPAEADFLQVFEGGSKPETSVPDVIDGAVPQSEQTRYETHYQLQPQPERRQSFASSIRSGLQSIGYAPEAATIPTSPVEPSPEHEFMAITSSTPTRAVLALRSSDSVSYTGAAYYQRFSTPSPGPGSISNLAATNTPPQQTPPQHTPPQHAPQHHTPPQHTSTPERHPSLPRHTTPPSSYKPPPGRFPMDDKGSPSMSLPTNSPNNPPPPMRPTVDTQRIRRRPLGNTAIKSSPHSPIHTPFSPQTPTASRPSSRSNSLTSSHFSYNAQSGFYTPNDTRRGGQQNRFPGLPSNSQSHSPSYNGVLPFATGTPPRRQRSGSSGSVGPGGYPHLGHEFMQDRAMYGLDLRDVPVRRANDLVTSYGSTSAGFQHQRRPSTEYDAYRGAGAGVGGVNYDAGGYEEREERKKESFWRKAAGVGRGRSKSQVRAGEVVRY
ncbi:hypothetical protein Dda_3241 [Drechslerella dactyloides]|uniref:Uncharacterized protein n=1 Tax=Drechslerella dactyloides TaxID=74499 RepID=A0AAD6NMN6_DREDA|nr:hypothetical protein Dda_3241 [Drechslerella dactyloides]